MKLKRFMIVFIGAIIFSLILLECSYQHASTNQEKQEFA